LSIHSHKPLTLTAYYLTRAKHRENTIQRPIWVDRYNWQSGLANGWFWPVPVIRHTQGRGAAIRSKLLFIKHEFQ
jgi:hypothetical protein